MSTFNAEVENEPRRGESRGGSICGVLNPEYPFVVLGTFYVLCKNLTWVFFIHDDGCDVPKMFHTAVRLTTRCDSIGSIGDQ